MEWEKVCNRFEGWIDGDLVCWVDKDEDGWGWGDCEGFGYGGFDTTEEAIADAEWYFSSKDEIDFGFSEAELEEIRLEILGDILYEERRDMGLA